MVARLLLQNGTVLQHDAQDNVIALKNTDILIQGDRIIEIGQGIEPRHASKIDCDGKIIAPGFINAHHHVWQSQLKGRLGDSTMLDYMLEANLQSFNFTPDDIFWGQLAGCLEALDAGTTCVVDNAHGAFSTEHGPAALSATLVSGIRSIFCHGVMPLRAAEWTESSFELDRSPQPDWLLPQMDSLAAKAPFGDDKRVQLGFFFDSYFLPENAISETLNRVKDAGVKIITSHYRHWPVSKGQSRVPEQLHACGLLGADVLLTHGNGTTPEQASLLTEAGTYIVSTPDAEIFMASGADPVAFRQDLPLTCLGADCHSCGPVSMMHQMQIALASDRGMQNLTTFAQGHYPKKMRATVQRAFNLATIKAARAINMDKDIGSIAVGKLADLVIFDTTSPSISCAADHDPLTAIVRHAGVREVETVIVGGEVRKHNGSLQTVHLAEGREAGFDLKHEAFNSKDGLSWKEIAKELSRSRSEIEGRINKVNKELAKEKLIGMMGGLQDILVDL
ncbi:5-methylthioadenosine S-adenosylhomocysteine deaminase [Fusarium agapanthi]|uniref:5-methylthioadenosine S-adenosylhomocysteine deaminase n=1 Tax=Fusarium agapanthi TaxID=1803897 RepID=A0A9P5EGJ4_9HYPO|nr:5-methylthioadenosine S-adenosylhomocysteine deaminase [Fusarium agapanthi]